MKIFKFLVSITRQKPQPLCIRIAVLLRGLNLTPCEQHRFAVALSCYVATVSLRSREQLCSPRWKASFPTRLRCVICAPRAFGLRRCADGKSFLLRQKKKNTAHSIEYAVLLAEKKGFEPSRRLPDLHP